MTWVSGFLLIKMGSLAKSPVFFFPKGKGLNLELAMHLWGLQITIACLSSSPCFLLFLNVKVREHFLDWVNFLKGGLWLWSNGGLLIIFPPRVYARQLSTSYKGFSHSGLVLTLNTSFNHNYLFKEPVSKHILFVLDIWGNSVICVVHMRL